MRATILVTGSNGQLGSELKELASAYTQYNFVFFTREEFPITDEVIARNIFELHQPSFFINCAAYTAVDKAESEWQFAKEINGTAVGMMASLCKEFNTKFIHVSTDYVFKGDQLEPLDELAEVDPVNAYGASKLLGEQLAFENNPDTIIIRTSWVYSSFGKNFVKTMIRLMSEKDSISVVGDQYGSPTYAADLAEAIMLIISSDKWVSGIYHFSNGGMISWFDFAEEIKKLSGLSCNVHSITTEEYPTPARRPKYSVMDKSKIRETFHIKIADWKEQLRICMEKI